MKLCSDNLALLADHPDLLEFIVTGDESSVPLYDPETKLSSMHWLTTEEPCPQKALRKRTQTSTMLITFFDAQGMLLKEFVPKGETVTGEFYVQVLTRLQDRVHRKRPNLCRQAGMVSITTSGFIMTMPPATHVLTPWLSLGPTISCCCHTLPIPWI